MNLTLNLTPNQIAGINFATANANAAAQATFDGAEQVKLKADKTYVVQTYAPITAEDYLTARINDIADNYSKQEIQSRINAPENQNLILQVASLPPDQMAAVLAQLKASVSPNS